MLGLVGLVLLVLLGGAFFGLHQVPEGHVGLYWVGGALQDRISPPGWHFMVQFVVTLS